METDRYHSRHQAHLRYCNATQMPCLLASLFLLAVLFAFPTRSPYARTPASQESDILGLCVSCIIKESGDREAIILGERHHRPQSQCMMLALVRELLSRGERLFVGLEIPADRQEDLERALGGQRPSKPLAQGITDHPGYHQMLSELGIMVRCGRPVTVAAIDAASSQNDRERAMYENVMKALDTGRYNRLLILVGNGHTLKNMKWDPEVPRRNLPKLAKRLAGDVEIYSIHQVFGEGQDGPSFMSTKTPDGAAVAMKGVDFLKYAPGMQGEDVADAVVLWGDRTADQRDGTWPGNSMTEK
jgi:hypothetical protein